MLAHWILPRRSDVFLSELKIYYFYENIVETNKTFLFRLNSKIELNFCHTYFLSTVIIMIKLQACIMVALMMTIGFYGLMYITFTTVTLQNEHFTKDILYRWIRLRNEKKQALNWRNLSVNYISLKHENSGCDMSILPPPFKN